MWKNRNVIKLGREVSGNNYVVPCTMTILMLVSPTCTDIFVPTRSAFVLVTKDSFVFLITNLNIKNNVY